MSTLLSMYLYLMMFSQLWEKVFWPSISNALTGVRAKEISKSRFPELFRARSRLHRSQILQVNTHLKALDEIYIFSLAPFQSSVIFQKFDTFFANFDAISFISANFAFFREIFADFFSEFCRISVISTGTDAQILYFSEI